MTETSKSRSSCIWAIVPAAGIGRRMGGEIPKQYLSLAGRSVLSHTLERLALYDAVHEIVVVLANEDPHWPQLSLDMITKPLSTVAGGQERCDSVLNGLLSLASRAQDDDWVLIHDAARPCVRVQDIQALVDACVAHAAGGLLAMPVKDTMKRANAQGYVSETVDREQLWHALTPQMFRYAELVHALRQASQQGVTVTDEAMAMELMGSQPLLVAGHSDNIKITRPEDLALAEFYLRTQVQDAHTA